MTAMMGGLVVSLAIRGRRVWVRIGTEQGQAWYGEHVELGGLART